MEFCVEWTKNMDVMHYLERSLEILKLLRSAHLRRGEKNIHLLLLNGLKYSFHVPCYLFLDAVGKLS